KHYFPRVVKESRVILGLLNKSQGDPAGHPDEYARLSPFTSGATEPGNERFLRHIAVRTYYDADISWQQRMLRNGYADTYLPEGSELVNRLLLQGNDKAEFIASRQPGVRSDGSRNAAALSIVDETECIQWIKKQLHVFSPSNPMAFSGPYKFDVPDGWGVERTLCPPAFAPGMQLMGIEEIRFP